VLLLFNSFLSQCYTFIFEVGDMLKTINEKVIEETYEIAKHLGYKNEITQSK
jgi:hypothetical protein